jgi:two-component system nitrate/nitrite response regulator NarP
MPWSLLVVDDVEEMRLMVRYAMDTDPRWSVVAEAADGVTAIELARHHQPDVVLLDLEMPWMSGAECLPYIQKAAPASHIVIWTVEPNSKRAASARDLGVLAVLDKWNTPASLLPSVLGEVVPAFA